MPPEPSQEPAPQQAASTPAPAPAPQKATAPKKLLAQADDSRSSAFYSAACCAALAGDSAQALESVKRSVQSGYYDAAYLQADPELAPLHSLAGWDEVVTGAKANLAKLPQPPRPVPVLASVDVYGSRRAGAEAVRKLLGFELSKP